MKNPSDFIAHYLAAVNAADADALLSLYADDARVFDAMAGWEQTRTSEFEAQVHAWLTSMEPGGHSRAEDVRCDVAGDLAAVSALVLYEGRMVEGGESVELWNRYTAVLRRGPAGWLISHEHTSVPIDMHTNQPLERAPR